MRAIEGHIVEVVLELGTVLALENGVQKIERAVSAFNVTALSISSKTQTGAMRCHHQ